MVDLASSNCAGGKCGGACVAKRSPAAYSVLLLPQYELVARGLSLREATAWVRTYNDVIHGDPAQAVLAEEFPQQRAPTEMAA